MYRVDEDDGTVVIMVLLSQPSTESIMATVNTSDITANGEVTNVWLLIHELKHLL